MKYGAIDIGTNSVRLLLAESEGHTIVKSKKYVTTTRLGSYINQDSIISEEGIEKTVEAIKEFGEKIEEYGCDKIYCIGTAALRKSENRLEFKKMAKEVSGIDVEIIDGDREAILGYRGVTGGVELDKDKCLIIDIGGGSTEFIFGNSKEIYYKKSINIGALLLTKKYITTMPEIEKEFVNLKNYIDSEVEKLYNEIRRSDMWVDSSDCQGIRLIGIGGTITQTSAIHQKLEEYSREKVHLSTVGIEDVSNQIKMISELNLEDRMKIKGIAPKRAEIILTGELILKSIMEKFKFNEITVSEYDNLEGLVLEDISGR